MQKGFSLVQVMVAVGVVALLTAAYFLFVAPQGQIDPPSLELDAGPSDADIVVQRIAAFTALERENCGAGDTEQELNNCIAFLDLQRIEETLGLTEVPRTTMASDDALVRHLESFIFRLSGVRRYEGFFQPESIRSQCEHVVLRDDFGGLAGQEVVVVFTCGPGPAGTVVLNQAASGNHEITHWYDSGTHRYRQQVSVEELDGASLLITQQELSRGVNIFDETTDRLQLQLVDNFPHQHAFVAAE